MSLSALFEHAGLLDTDPENELHVVAFSLSMAGQPWIRGRVDLARPRIVDRLSPAVGRASVGGAGRASELAAATSFEPSVELSPVDATRLRSTAPRVGGALPREIPRVARSLERLTGWGFGHTQPTAPGMLFGEVRFATLAVSHPMGDRRSFRVVITDDLGGQLAEADVADAIESVEDGRVWLRGADRRAPGNVLELGLWASVDDPTPEIR